MNGIDLVNGIVGAVCGIILAILFQQPLQDGWFRARRRFATVVRSLTYREGGAPLSTWSTFSIGPLHTSALVVEGDGEQAIAPESVRVQVLEGEVVLPEEMAAWRAEVEAAEEQAETSGTRVRVWNGPRYAVEGLEISRTALEEHADVRLRLRPTDYFTFLAAQQLDRRFADGTTPRGRYLDPDRPLDAPAFLQCSFGVNVAVVTADHLLVVSRRADNVRSGPGLWGSSVNEGLSRHIDSAGRSAPDLHDVARRGMREELSLEPQEYTLTLLAFVLDIERRQWSAHFTAHLTDLTGQALRSRISRGVADRWEHQSIEYVPFRPVDVTRYVLRPDRIRRWAPVTPALFHLALVHTHGRGAVERAEAQTVRRLRAEGTRLPTDPPVSGAAPEPR